MKGLSFMVKSSFLAFAMLFVLSLSAFGKTQVKASGVMLGKTWITHQTDDKLKKAPTNVSRIAGYIDNQADWSKFWKANKRGRDVVVPVVDFANNIVLVVEFGENASVFIGISANNTKDLRVSAGGTKRRSLGHTHAIVVVPRNGFQTIHGKPLAKKAALAQPAARAPAKQGALKILATHNVTIDKATFQKFGTGFVATNKQWDVIWKQIKPKEKAPKVDFSKNILLISSKDAANPNSEGVGVMQDNQGVIRIVKASTAIGFRPSNRVIVSFYQVARTGVTGVKRYDFAQQKTVVEKLPKSK